jgi:hypothetical protein
MTCNRRPTSTLSDRRSACSSSPASDSSCGRCRRAGRGSGTTSTRRWRRPGRLAGGNLYYTLNPCRPDLDGAAKNGDITERRWLFLDIDPRRPTRT